VLNISPITGANRANRYQLTVTAGTRITSESYETLEAALDSFDLSGGFSRKAVAVRLGVAERYCDVVLSAW
jgi:hypothetical protein